MAKKQEILLLIIIGISFKCNLISQSNLNLLSPKVVIDTFYGQQYKDPYRFMENTKDPQIEKWMIDQTEWTNSLLNKIAYRDSLIAKQNQSNGKQPITKYLRINENQTYFYLKKDYNENLYKLYFRKRFDSKEEFLFSPESYKNGKGKEYVINYIQPSWDGSKVAIGFTKNDEELSELAILDVKTRKLHSEVITNCWLTALGGVSWLNDNTGFYYVHIPVIEKSSKDYILNTASVLYILGNNPKDLQIVFSAKNNPKIGLKPEDFPIVYTKPYFNNILFGKVGGVGTYHDYYYSKINSNGEISNWEPLFKKVDKVYKFDFNGEDFYFLSALNSSNFKLCKTNFDDLDFRNPEILVKENKSSVLKDFALTKNGIYYVNNKDGVDARLFYLNGFKEQEISIPKPSGYINVISRTPNSNALWIEIEGWTNHLERYSYNFLDKKFIQADFYPALRHPELEDVIIEEIEVASHDGVKVPLSIIYKKGLQLNGQNRVLMGGYGAYGFSETPYLYDYLLHWVREGGVYATAHVRGGGEKGDAWRKDGYKQTKPNTWKDFIACAEFLKDNGYTNPSKMAVWGASAGGILIARAITDRPDLFKAAIILSGAINMLRNEFGPNGKNNIKEFGTVQDSSEFYALLKMDACQHITPRTNYPAVFMRAGTLDSRLPVWHSTKFTAGLQAATSSENPILLSIDFKGGHGLNQKSNKRAQKVADVISFALWQTGHPDFQPKE